VSTQQIARDLAATFADPVRMVRAVLGSDPWEKQEQILRALTKPQARVAVRACHSSGKTREAAEAVLWHQTAFTDGIAVTTAPTWPQVELLMWGEIHEALRHARMTYPEPNRTSLHFGPKNYAVGWSTNEGVRFQGIHAPHLLFIMDEAPGVRPDIWGAIEGARAGGDVRVLALGNPVIASGPFYDCFTKDRDRWHTISISAFDTPNLVNLRRTPDEPWRATLETLLALGEDDLDRNVRPYLTTRRWVKEKWLEWGQHQHPLWDARVLGDFPAQDEFALLSLSWIEEANRRMLTPPTDKVTVGIDVAGPGECETALCARSGPMILEEQAWPMADPRGEVVRALRKYGPRLEHVNVDANGIGYGMALHLADLHFPVRFVNVREAANDKERFRNQKAEFYWGLRERYEAGDVGGQVSEKTVQQLSSIRWGTNARGQVEIETKDDAAKRGVESPDRAEAVMLCFAPSGGAPLATGLSEDEYTPTNWGSAP
jgi:phage terminase large subunit